MPKSIMKISMSPPPLTVLASQGLHANIKDSISVTHTTEVIEGQDENEHYTTRKPVVFYKVL